MQIIRGAVGAKPLSAVGGPLAGEREGGASRSTGRVTWAAPKTGPSPPHPALSPAQRERGLISAGSDRVELPGYVVGDAPEIADVGLADERVGAALVPPVEEIDVLPARQGR
jgi:hypothetical protein